METMDNYNLTRLLLLLFQELIEDQPNASTRNISCHRLLCKLGFNSSNDLRNSCRVYSHPANETYYQPRLPISQILAKYIHLYVYPIFILLGILGNSLSFFVMLINVRRGSAFPASLYLTFLAFTDGLFLLISALPDWIYQINTNLDLKSLSDFSCRFVYWFGHLTTHLSAGLVVALTVERFIAVQYPLIAHKINTITRTRFALLFLIVCYLILDSPVLVLVQHFKESFHEFRLCPNSSNLDFQTSNLVRCSLAEGNYEKTWVYIDFAVYALIPSAIIITLNSLIIRRLLDAQRFRQHMFRFYNSTLSRTDPTETKFRHSSETAQTIELAEKSLRNIRQFRSLSDGKSSGIPLRQQLSQVEERRLRYSMKQSSISTEYSTLSFETKTRSNYQFDSSFIRHHKSLNTSRTNNTRLTILLLFVSGSFLLLTLPIVIWNLILSIKSNESSSILFTNSLLSPVSTDSTHPQMILFYTLTRLLMIINHSINFILYLLLGKRFRRDFKQIFLFLTRRFCRQKHRRLRRQRSHSYQKNSR